MRGPLAGTAMMWLERFMVTRHYDKALSERTVPPGSHPFGRRTGTRGDAAARHRSRAAAAARRCRPHRDVRRQDGDGGRGSATSSPPPLPCRTSPSSPPAGPTTLPALRARAPANLQIGQILRRRSLPGVSRRAAIFFFPSSSETFGIVVAEAMAVGAAVVSSIDTIAFEGAKAAPETRPG